MHLIAIDSIAWFQSIKIIYKKYLAYFKIITNQALFLYRVCFELLGGLDGRGHF